MNMKEIKNRDTFNMDMNQMLRRMTISGADEMKHLVLLSIDSLNDDEMQSLDLQLLERHQLYHWEPGVLMMVLSATKEEAIGFVRQFIENVRHNNSQALAVYGGITPVFMEDDDILIMQNRAEKALRKAKKMKNGTVAYALENSVFVN